jgi:nicotinamidase-related amidase
MGHPALLIIDMQNDFVLEGKPMRVAGAGTVIPQIQVVPAEFRRRSLPVFHVMRVHRSDGSDVEIIRQKLFHKQPFAVAGTPGAASEEVHRANIRDKQNIGVKIVKAADLVEVLDAR